MEASKTELDGLLIIKPRVFEDSRGYFFESYNVRDFLKNGVDYTFVQDNQSKSNKNTLRGLHYQKAPYGQGKLVRVLSGAVLDVAVDIRKGSPTYGQHFKSVLSEENKKMLWIPPGFAHGFLSLEDNTVFFYKCTSYYNKNAEDVIAWDDPDLNIDWGVSNPIVSERDRKGRLFKNI